MLALDGGGARSFSLSARALVEDRTNDLFLSAASAWEIAIKHALGSCGCPSRPRAVPGRLAALQTLPLPVEHAHALNVASLPPIIGIHSTGCSFTAQLEALSLLTAGPLFERYDVSTLPA